MLCAAAIACSEKPPEDTATTTATTSASGPLPTTISPPGPTASSATALTLADGTPTWRSDIAGPTVDGPPQTFGVVPAPGGLQVLVTRSDEANTLPLVAAIHPMSAAGVAGTTRPLAVPELFGPLLVPARGPCGDLLAIHLATPAWLGSFAP